MSTTTYIKTVIVGFVHADVLGFSPETWARFVLFKLALTYYDSAFQMASTEAKLLQMTRFSCILFWASTGNKLQGSEKAIFYNGHKELQNVFYPLSLLHLKAFNPDEPLLDNLFNLT